MKRNQWLFILSAESADPRRKSDESFRTITLCVRIIISALILTLIVANFGVACAQGGPLVRTLEQQLLDESPQKLAKAARQNGDARRGALVFYQAHLACTKCHIPAKGQKTFGPDLSRRKKPVTDEYLVESVLHPSKELRKGFESVTIITSEGKTVTGLLVEDRPKEVLIRSVERGLQLETVSKDDIEERANGKLSIMPKGLVNLLANRQQFLDLINYLIDIGEKGPDRAKQLQPPPALYAQKPIPEYEKHIDHASMIAGLNNQSFKRGEAIYNRLCINCHGDKTRPGSLPTSLRFASGKFRNGNDPYSMYRTVTHGFGMMVRQAWMVPQQKYDVVHYIREEYLKKSNPTQYFNIDDEYLAGLPKGNTRGPAPSNSVPWRDMNYGNNLIGTYEIGNDGTNFAYKGIAVRLDGGPGGVSRGGHWMVFDHDTLRVAAAWTGDEFIDYHGIMFDGRHNIHPRVTGDVHLVNPTGPGWANPDDGSFTDTRLKGRDDRLYGPLPRRWAHYKGLFHYDKQVVIHYTVGETNVLEMPGLDISASSPIFTRTFAIGPRDRDMVLQVAHVNESAELKLLVTDGRESKIAVFGKPNGNKRAVTKQEEPVEFNGMMRIDVAGPKAFNMTDRDYSIVARFKTKKAGTIFSKTKPTGPWVPNGKTLFVRGGRLGFDIGWVGVVTSRTRVNDGRWHDVAMTYKHETRQVRLYVDGKFDAQRKLAPRARVDGHVIRIGYTSPNFPEQDSFFKGQIEEVRFLQRTLSQAEISNEFLKEGTVGHWRFDDATGVKVPDLSGRKHHGKVVRGQSMNVAGGTIVASISRDIEDAQWSSTQGNLRLTIPAGATTKRFILRMTRVKEAPTADLIGTMATRDYADLDLKMYMEGGPQRWPRKLTADANVGKVDGPFAVDVLTRPKNPWQLRIRPTGFDFFPDGKRMAVCTWDGDVWIVSGLDRLQENGPAARTEQLTWQRIESGLFQPLGVRFVDAKIYVTCRDQLAILHDFNDDNEVDFVQNFNNDHQVTDHFHEFAMGLQTDEEGNFYYAKSARHALKAVVPHHGTLLRVSRDGSKTDILATGFRAANGVCLNPDGTFIVTDQEGHWNPKNRINYVKIGGFYGNMYGYHDVTDSSDDVMEQPLCWITNAFDRSPSELLWVDSKRWGPLNGSLLNFSYGYGKVYIVPHEKIDGQAQGGMCEFPIPKFPTGIMRGRFNPADGQLYTCGMFAWAGSQHQPGGLYRIRYTGKPVHLPVGLKARKNGMEIHFSAEIDPETASNIKNYRVKTWSLKRTANYGSKHYDEKPSRIASARVSKDRKTVFLEILDIKPTWCMEIKYTIKNSNDKWFDGTIHNTIHQLGK